MPEILGRTGVSRILEPAMTDEEIGEVVYGLNRWVSPAVEYDGDMGPIQPLPSSEHQQHFIVPALNFYFLPQLELNLGVGVGLTNASDGVFIKSIVGWTF